MIKELEKIFDALEEELENILKELDIKDGLITKYAYDTLSTARLEISKPNGTKYAYTQLKGEFKNKSKTIKYWKHEETPFKRLEELIKLYRGLKLLSKALSYLRSYEKMKSKG
ncbi:MAG: hypothetical protein QW328_09880 [Nitrososphaerota archaeon]